MGQGSSRAKQSPAELSTASPYVAGHTPTSSHSLSYFLSRCQISTKAIVQISQKAKSENLSQTAAIAEPNIDPQIERVLSANLSEAPSFVPSIFLCLVSGELKI